MRCSYQVYRPCKACCVGKQQRREHFCLHSMWTSNISESQVGLNKDLIVAKFGECQSPKSPYVTLGHGQPTTECVAQGFLSLWYSEGGRCCSALKNAASSSVCSWCLTYSALLHWPSEVQGKLWTWVVIFSLLFPSRKISKPLLTGLKIFFARFCDSIDLILYFKCGHTQMQLMWVVFFLETQAKKHSTFIPHGPTPCLPQGNSAHLSFCWGVLQLRKFS